MTTYYVLLRGELTTEEAKRLRESRIYTERTFDKWRAARWSDDPSFDPDAPGERWTEVWLTDADDDKDASRRVATALGRSEPEGGFPVRTKTT